MEQIPFPSADPNEPAVTATATANEITHPVPTYINHLKPLMDDKGMIDLSKLDFVGRIQALEAFEEKANANLICFQENIMSQLAPGTTFVPMVVIPKADDIWDEDAAKKIGCKTGLSEVKADFIIAIGQRAGVQLKKVYDGPRVLDGVKMYSVRYNAFILQGDGVPLMVEDVGKDQPMYNSTGLAAHIVESTTKKAERNAICKLLQIKKIMDLKTFNRPWLILRPVFTDPTIQDEIKQLGDRAKALLYDNTQTIDVDAEPMADVESLKTAIGEASSPDDFEVLRKKLAASRLNTDERTELGVLYKQKLAAVESLAAAAEPLATEPVAG